MDYIREMRGLIGHRPLIMVGAAALMLDSQERLLLLRRADNDCWGLPGGAMEPGESLDWTGFLRVNQREHTAYQFFELSCLPSPINAPDQPIIRRFAEKR